MILLMGFFYITGYNRNAAALILIFWWIILGIWIVTGYYRRKKYFDRARGARIRKMFDYTINLEPNLTEEYVKAGFPGSTDGKYYLIDEELKFSVKCLGGTDENYTGDVIRLGFAYDKKSLDGGLLETGQDAAFTKSIFNEDLVVEPEAVDFINSIPADKIRDVINDLFKPI